MNIVLKRTIENERGTFGELSVDGVFICYTAEPPNIQYKKSVKPYCIDKGKYDVILNVSQRFSQKSPYNKYAGVPLLLNVKGFEGVRIHCGNYPLIDTLGCILVGLLIKDNVILLSVEAYNKLMNIINKLKLNIEIK